MGHASHSDSFQHKSSSPLQSLYPLTRPFSLSLSLSLAEMMQQVGGSEVEVADLLV